MTNSLSAASVAAAFLFLSCSVAAADEGPFENLYTIPDKDTFYQDENIQLIAELDTPHEELSAKFYIVDEDGDEELLDAFELEEMSAGASIGTSLDFDPGEYHFLLKLGGNEYETDTVEILDKDDAGDPNIRSLSIDFVHIPYDERDDENDYKVIIEGTPDVDFKDLFSTWSLKCSEKIVFSYKGGTRTCSKSYTKQQSGSKVMEHYWFDSNGLDKDELEVTVKYELTNTNGVELDTEVESETLDLTHEEEAPEESEVVKEKREGEEITDTTSREYKEEKIRELMELLLKLLTQLAALHGTQ